MSTEDFEMLSRETGDYRARGQFIGVFLKAHGSEPTVPYHVGLIYVDVKNETRALHYVTTNRLCDDPLITAGSTTLKPFYHAPLPFDPDDAVGVAGILASSETKEWLIRYSMNWPDGAGAFVKVVQDDGNESLSYGFKPDEGGLTCATFVAEVLAGLGHTVVDWKSWKPNRPGDIAFRKERLAEYERTMNTKITPRRVEEMRAQDPFYRLRPEEIAAAATRPPIEEWPVSYEDAISLAEEVLRRFADASNVPEVASAKRHRSGAARRG